MLFIFHLMHLRLYRTRAWHASSSSESTSSALPLLPGTSALLQICALVERLYEDWKSSPAGPPLHGLELQATRQQGNKVTTRICGKDKRTTLVHEALRMEPLWVGLSENYDAPSYHSPVVFANLIIGQEQVCYKDVR
ncbi:hypothetical protein SCHPADRAFT_356117 [Schizopora paradoxa]|uniref:Uncharacterized protein n=1 Tax=Schizopora paradoxa TaxID=27342 RepID=A0A0H2RPQ6_9AGAM|nr:hypothetical protein SCHPADRAFT_356117 [Schizopora paradoxa]